MKFSEVIHRAEQRATKSDLLLSLWIEDLGSKESAHLNVNSPHSSASLIKVPIMMAVLEEAGKSFSLEEKIKLSASNTVDFSVVSEIGEENYTIEEYLRWMMMESCNASTNVLIDLIGLKSVNRIFSDLAMDNTILQRKMMNVEARKSGRDNFTSAEDMAKLFKALYHREYFSEEAAMKGLKLMEKCRSYQLLQRYLPDSPPFAHKTGGLEHVSHDVGIFLGKNNLLVCALCTQSTGEENDPRRTSLLGHIGRWLFKE